jgi:hypothetical protein
MQEQSIKTADENQPVTAKKLKYLRDKHRQKVKGIFKFHEVPGGQVSFFFREFKQDPIERYTLCDGQVYEIPLGVAKHLNKNCWYPVHAHKLDENGNPDVVVGAKVKRTSFQSLEFMDPEDVD